MNYIYSNSKGIVITTNKRATLSDLNIIEKYMKDLNDVNSNNIMSPRLSQSKSYLKILGILYFMENINLSIISDIIERVIQSTHIFNNIVWASHPQVIKIFPKSDIVVIWVNIWNLQNSIKVKYFINKCFNVGYYIMTIREKNINPGVPQCKNY